MTDDYLTVPLKDNESALPINGVSVPQYAYASFSFSGTEYRSVRIDDDSPYELVPMKFVDRASLSPDWS